MKKIINLARSSSEFLLAGSSGLQSPFLVLLRLYFFWQLFLTGKGKLANIGKVSEFFASLGIPLLTMIECDDTNRAICKNPLGHETLDLGDGQTFHVAIVYEDSRAGRQAKHFYDRLIQASKMNATLAWNFGVSRYSHSQGLGSRVRKPPREQDFVMLSMHGKS